MLFQISKSRWFPIQYQVIGRLFRLPFKTLQGQVLARPGSQVVLLYTFQGCLRSRGYLIVLLTGQGPLPMAELPSRHALYSMVLPKVKSMNCEVRKNLGLKLSPTPYQPGDCGQRGA